MPGMQQHTLDLTGPSSHTFELEPGVGNVYIGPHPQARDVPQLKVTPEQVLNWRAFAERDVRGAYPWPRWIYYDGNDIGFADWSQRRAIEKLTWSPQAPVSLDASKAQIGTLCVRLDQHEVTLELPAALDLAVEGNAARLQVRSVNCGHDVDLCFSTCDGRGVHYYPELSGVRSLTVYAGGDPVAGDVIAQYTSVETLLVSGALAQVDALSALTELRSLTIRDNYLLSQLPSLDTWPHLTDLLVVGAAKSDGTRLRKQAKGIPELKARVTRLS